MLLQPCSVVVRARVVPLIRTVYFVWVSGLITQITECFRSGIEKIRATANAVSLEMCPIPANRCGHYLSPTIDRP
jgi:hypothetical protein